MIKGHHFIADSVIVNLIHVCAIEKNSTRPGITFYFSTMGTKSLYVPCDTTPCFEELIDYFRHDTQCSD